MYATCIAGSGESGAPRAVCAGERAAAYAHSRWRTGVSSPAAYKTATEASLRRYLISRTALVWSADRAHEGYPSVADSPSLYEPSFEHDACGFGFVCDVAGRPSHGIVRDALTVLVNLEHRGASGSERNTGDGAGILAQVPFSFLGTVAAEQGLHLPDGGGYGVGMVFLPRDAASRTACEGHVAKVLLTE